MFFITCKILSPSGAWKVFKKSGKGTLIVALIAAQLISRINIFFLTCIQAQPWFALRED